MMGRITTLVREGLARRWVLRTLIIGLGLAVVFFGFVAVGATGRAIVRDVDGCPRSVGSFGSVSWIDVVHTGGVTYERVDLIAPHEATVSRTRVGPRLGTVRCAIADAVQKPGYKLRDGEAIFLEPGTAVHALTGADVGFRIVAMDDGSPVVYENRSRPGARTGADLLPFATQQVRGVTFLSEEDGRTVLGELTDGDAVRDFVEALKGGAVDRKAARSLGEEPRVFVALELTDQPAFTLVMYPGKAITTDGLRLSDEVLARIP